MFLCVDDGCNTVADLLYITSPGASLPTLAMGYVRFPFSLVGLPTRYLDSTAVPSLVPLPLSAPAQKSASATRFDGADISMVQWQPKAAPLWVDAYPNMIEFSIMTRLFTIANNTDWSALRLGNYKLAESGDCVSIVTMVHPWMDQQGWNISDDCIPTQTYIFSSYLPQAYFNWSSHVVDHYTREILGFTTDQSQSIMSTDWLNSIDSPYKELNYGRIAVCDGTMARNLDNNGPGTNCYATDYRTAVLDQYNAGNKAVALQIGNASILAWNITEQKLRGPNEQGHMYMDGGDYGHQGGGYNAIQAGIAQPLLNLAVLADSAVLPWCSNATVPCYCNSSTVPKTANVYSNDGSFARLGTIFDCDTMWPVLGWGPLRPQQTVATAAAATATTATLSGAALLSKMQISYANVTAGTGFVGGERVIPSSTAAGINVILQSAAVLLEEQLISQLSATDVTLTWQSAVLAITQTIVAIIATYASRKETLHVISKSRAPLLAKVLTAVIATVAIVMWFIAHKWGIVEVTCGM